MHTRIILYHYLAIKNCSLRQFSTIIDRSLLVTVFKLAGILEFTASDIECFSSYFSKESAKLIFFSRGVDFKSTFDDLYLNFKR